MSYEPVEGAEQKGSIKVGVAAFAATFVVYAATLAPTVTWWDAGELIAAVHSLGIPHPPGTALYVLLARVWAMLLWPFEYAVRINLFSAFATAAAIGIFGALLARWTRDRAAAFAAAICAGAGSTVWRSANEAEVYALALLAAAVVLWAADRAATVPADRLQRWLSIWAYACGLAWAVHLAALVMVPAAAVLIVGRRKISGDRPRVVLPILLAGAAALGASVVLLLLVRAQHDPAINQGNPETLRALYDVLTRAQYPDAGYWPRQAPLWLQIGNWFEYADWQFALGLHSAPPPSWARTSVTAVFAILGALGCAAHRRLDRASWRAMLIAFLTAGLGVVLYLNLKAGPSYGYGFLPEGTPHEARERDYFFALSFLIWGLWAGFGAVRCARDVARRMSLQGTRAKSVVIAGIVVAALPIVLNWPATDRARGPEARDARLAARRILDAAPSRALLFVAGDNDTYPLWYAQQVEKHRADVVVVTIPLLGAKWYREELARRHSLLDPLTARRWRGLQPTVLELCERALEEGRAVSLAPNVRADRLAPTCDSTR